MINMLKKFISEYKLTASSIASLMIFVPSILLSLIIGPIYLLAFFICLVITLFLIVFFYFVVFKDF